MPPFMLPGVFACYKTDGNLKKLKKDNAYLHRLIDANIEGYRAIRNAGHEILPDADKEFEGAAWTRKRSPIFSLDLSVCGRNIRAGLCRNGQYTHMVDLQTESQRWAI